MRLTLAEARRRLGRVSDCMAPPPPRPVSVEALEAHALELAKRLNIKVRYWAGSRTARARAFVEQRVIEVERITSETTYCVFLHECGHVETDAAARPLGKDFIVGDALYNSAGESRAWTWARAHALIWTSEMQRELRRGLRVSVPYATHGIADPIWRELDEIDGKLTAGHARWKLDTVVEMTLADARRRLAHHITLKKETHEKTHLRSRRGRMRRHAIEAIGGV